MKELSTYLKDHLAGSTGALEMLDDVIEGLKDKPLEPLLRALRDDIAADQQELKQLMAQLDIEESTMRKAGAWMAEKLSRAKLGVGDAGEPNLALLQSLEGLSLGIMGKRSLWRTMAKAAETAPRLRGFDFARLEQRALDQFEQVHEEVVRLAGEIFPAELNAPKSD